MTDLEHMRRLFGSVPQSPYQAMFTAGFGGVPLEDCVSYLASIGVPVRAKDVAQWEAGSFKYRMKIMNPMSTNAPLQLTLPSGVSFESARLSDFEKLPDGWVGTKKRFFPCTSDNKPMKKWGWSSDYDPGLMDCSSAKALSPVGWVGQNMLYQPFVVMDIDGVGHGTRDEYVIAFGNMFRDKTMCMEDPNKKGSFHLYFKTDRLIPVKHFPYAKLDLMGNAVNAAVYLKNKRSNGLPMAELTEEVWRSMMQYQQWRKELVL